MSRSVGAPGPAPRWWRGPWALRVAGCIVVAVALNVSLSRLRVAHDTAVLSVLVLAIGAVGVLTLAALDATAPAPWSARRPDEEAGDGEDTRTAAYRHVVEAHLTARHADDTVVRQVADLADRRLRQVHGFGAAEDPARARELLGPVLADWVLRDRRQRPAPGERVRRWTPAELSDVVRRIESL